MIRDHLLPMPGGGLARIRGGPRQVQDSRGGGGASINLHTKGGLPDLLFWFYF